MNRRDFFKRSFLLGVAVAAPIAVKSEEKNDEILIVRGKNGKAIVDYNERTVHITGMIEAEKLWHSCVDFGDTSLNLVFDSSPPIQKGGENYYYLNSEWQVDNPRSIIDCVLEGVHQITLLGYNNSEIIECYIDGQAVNSSLNLDLVHVESSNGTCIRPLTPFVDGHRLKIIVVSEERAIAFEVEVSSTLWNVYVPVAL